MKNILFVLLCSFQFVLFAQTINLNGNLGSINTCSSDFYDSGGAVGNYQNNENYTVTFYPSGNGMVQMMFNSFVSENNYDSLLIYDGPTANYATKIGRYIGTLNPFTVTATNPSGCLTLVWVSDGSVMYAGWNATITCVAPPINLTSLVVPSACNASNGSIDVSVLGGIPPYTYTWSNGANTEDISNLAPGMYMLTMVDSAAYTLTDTFYINAANLSISPTITPSACDSTGGSIDLAMSGGTSPYLISWNNGQTGSLLSNLAPGGYSATVYDSNGCFAYWSGLVDLEDSCTATISGYIYNDINGNCVQDAGENPFTNAFVNLTPGGGAFTDINGYYEFEVIPGTYNVQYYPNPFTITSACGGGFNQQLILNVGANAYNTDFPLQLITVQDVEVNLYENDYVPGLNHTTSIYYQNNSSMAMTPTITWQHSSLISPNTYNVAPTSYDPLTHTATWNLPSMASLSSGFLSIQSITDTLAIIGDTARSIVQISPTSGDSYLYDNQDTVVKAVVASFDPNQKTAYPLGQGAYHFISPSQNILHYTIDFQNTGTYPATNVVIRDTLDAALDAFSVQMGNTSHAYTVDLQNDNILVFRFYNINLPDSFSNEPASHGFVTYTIKTHNSLPLGTAIHNSASIYFDFNAPILTNSTLHTIYIAPTINVTANSDCDDAEVTITVTNGVSPYNYSWSNGITSIGDPSNVFSSVLGASGYSMAHITDIYGTTSNIDSIWLDQAVLDASFSYNVVGDTLFFTPNTLISANYYWNFGNGQTSTQTYPYLIISEEFYEVTLEVANGCGALTYQELISLTAISAPYQGKISLFPNPMTDVAELSVDFPSGKPYNVQITDITGKVLQKWENISDKKLMIHKEMLPAGTYFVEVKGEGTFVEKLLIK